MPKIAKELKSTQLNALPIGAHAVGGVPGLVLDCKGDRGSGAVKSRTWILRATVAGQRRWIGIGPLHTFGLSEARDRARQLRAQIIDGSDPLADKRAIKAQAIITQQNAVTFDKAAEEYIEQHRPGWKSAKHAQQWENTLATYASPIIGSLSVADIAPVHVVEVLRPIWNTKNETATRLRERIEKVIGAADAQAGRQRLNPARWKGNIDAMLPAPAKIQKVKHHPALPYARLPDFIATLAERDGVAARALMFAILCAGRGGDVRGMVWREVDLQHKLWVVPAARMKAGREHRVPLTKEMLDLLPKRGRPDDLVFPSPNGSALSDAAMGALIDRMNDGLKGSKRWCDKDGNDIVVHGFRSTFSDWVTEQTQHSPEAREMALAHAVSSAVEAAYRRGDMFEKRRQLMDDWAAFATSKMQGGE